MPILVMCSNPACGELFDAPDAPAGGTVTCPACGTVQAVAAPAAAPRPAAAEQPAPQPPPAPPEAPKPPESLDLAPADAAAAGPDRAAGLSDSRWEGILQAAEPDVEDEVDLTPAEAQPAAARPAPPEPVSPRPAPPAEGETGPIATVSRQVPEKPAEAPASLEEMPFLSETALSELTASAGAPPADSLQQRPAPVVIFSLGVLGMGAGLAAGLVFHPTWPVLSAYGGAVAGWVVGFIIAFLIVLAVEREEQGPARCRVCRHVLADEATTCGWCGSSVAQQGLDALNAGCLRAGSYAVSNLTSVVMMVFPLLVAALLIALTAHLLAAFEAALRPWRPALIGVCAAAGLMVFAHWMQFSLSVVRQTGAGSGKAPDAPRFWALGNFAAGARGLGVLAMYVMPVCTIPLLPLGLLALSRGRKGGAFNLPVTVRAAWRHCRDFAVLWLWLLLWSAVVSLALAAATIALVRVRRLVPPVPGYSGVLVSMMLVAAAVLVVGAIGCVLAVVLFRCIGTFGRRVRLAGGWAAPPGQADPAEAAGAEKPEEPV